VILPAPFGGSDAYQHKRAANRAQLKESLMTFQASHKSRFTHRHATLLRAQPFQAVVWPLYHSNSRKESRSL